MARRVGLLAVPLLLAAVVAGCGGSSAKKTANGCTRESAPKSRSETRTKPTRSLDPAKVWTASVETSCGTFAIRLDVKDSPHTTASFVSLARSGFYDDTTFHRIVPGFVIQGGDPTGSGTGGPGYSVVDRPPATTKYTLGTVAMAKTGADPAGTSGSQFFVVTGDASFLTPDYAVLGKVVRGMSVASRIGRLGQKTEEGTPTQVVLVRHITISSS